MIKTDKIFLEINRELAGWCDNLMTCTNIDHAQFNYDDAKKIYTKTVDEIRIKVNKYLDFQLEGFDELIRLGDTVTIRNNNIFDTKLHGKWKGFNYEYRGEIRTIYQCSVCHHPCSDTYDCCPHCGAYMKGDTNDE